MGASSNHVCINRFLAEKEVYANSQKAALIEVLYSLKCIRGKNAAACWEKSQSLKMLQVALVLLIAGVETAEMLFLD